VLWLDAVLVVRDIEVAVCRGLSRARGACGVNRFRTQADRFGQSIPDAEGFADPRPARATIHPTNKKSTTFGLPRSSLFCSLCFSRGRERVKAMAPLNGFLHYGISVLFSGLLGLFALVTRESASENLLV
jgi:hypothetical protein